MDNTISNIPDVFNIFVSNVEMADALSVGTSTVSEMKRRKSIPVEYWPALVDAARGKGREDLTLEKLAIISADAARRRKMAKEAAA